MTEFFEKSLFVVSMIVLAVSYGVSGAEAGHMPPARSIAQIQTDSPDPIDTDAALTAR